MSNETQTQFKTEGQPAFSVEDKENDNSSDSSTGKETNTDQTQSQEGDQNSGANKDDSADDNFADHPRWKSREANWSKRFNEQEKRHVDELAKIREELDGKIQSISKTVEKDTPIKVPSWFGGDEQQWSEFQQWNNELVGKAKSEALNEIKSKSEAEQKAIDEATTYFQEQVQLLETDQSINPQGEKVDRNKLLKFVLDNDLVDSKGRWNYRAGYLLIKGNIDRVKVDDNNEKKKIANATTSDNRGETKPSAFMTSADFKKPGARPW